MKNYSGKFDYELLHIEGNKNEFADYLVKTCKSKRNCKLLRNHQRGKEFTESYWYITEEKNLRHFEFGEGEKKQHFG